MITWAAFSRFPSVADNEIAEGACWYFYVCREPGMLPKHQFDLLKMLFENADNLLLHAYRWRNTTKSRLHVRFTISTPLSAFVIHSFTSLVFILIFRSHERRVRSSPISKSLINGLPVVYQKGDQQTIQSSDLARICMLMPTKKLGF